MIVNEAQTTSDLPTLAAGIREAMVRANETERHAVAAAREHIDAIAEVGRKLLAARAGFTSDNAFGAWCQSEGLAVGILADRRDRAAAMLIAKAVSDDRTPDSLDTCPARTPNGIMAWINRRQPKQESAKKSQVAKQRPSPKTDEVSAIIEEKREQGSEPTSRVLKEETGYSTATVDRGRIKANTRAEVTEELLAELELDVTCKAFTPKQKITLDKAIARHKAKLEKEFKWRVNREVEKNIAESNDYVRQRCTELRREVELLSDRLVFTSLQFKKLQMCIHPDSSASVETRNEMSDFLVKNKARLVKPDFQPSSVVLPTLEDVIARHNDRAR